MFIKSNIAQAEVNKQDSAIIQFLRLIQQPDSVIELRILNTPTRGTLSGYYNDIGKLVREASTWDANAPAVYVTLNPVKKDLLARSDNRLQERARHTTADNDVIRRCWLPIDFDPERASGISSTDSEHASALNMAQQVSADLKELGWPDPIYADSGNGAHLLYSIDLPNDEPSRDLVKKCLEALHLRYSNEAVNIDTAVFNAARIWKLYGTTACKGDNTPDRPHRMSGIIQQPDHLTVVNQDLLAALAAQVPQIASYDTGHPARSIQNLDVESWLSDHEIAFSSRKPWNGGILWVLENCPWNSDHTNRSAYIIKSAAGMISAGCHHNSCQGKNWRDLRTQYEPGWSDDSNDDRRDSQINRLLAIAKEAAPFKDQFEDLYATITVDGHKENLPINSGRFKQWLTYRYKADTGAAATPDTVSRAIYSVESDAAFSGSITPLHLRVAMREDLIWYDLGDPQWQAVRITPDGWDIVRDTPPLFKRFGNTAPQVIPQKANDGLRRLLKYVNLQSEEAKELFLVYTVTNFVPEIGHVLGAFSGTKGAAKSTAMRVLRKLVDPALEELYIFPQETKQLVLDAAQNYMPAFDNLDKINDAHSNVLCQVSTGGGLSMRKLYTNRDEVIFSFKHPVTINGINPVVTKPDLLDRTLLFELEAIKPQNRRTEADFWNEFEEDRPFILGGIFDTLSAAMKIRPAVKLSNLPRMADFCCWGYAVAEAIGIGGSNFINLYKQNIGFGNETAIANNPVASAVVAFMAARDTEWKGKVSSLLNELNTLAELEKISTFSKEWPKAANTLRGSLAKVKANLEEVGITYTISKITSGRDKGNVGIVLRKDVPSQDTVTLPAQTIGEMPAYGGHEHSHQVEDLDPTNRPCSGKGGDGGYGGDAVAIFQASLDQAAVCDHILLDI